MCKKIINQNPKKEKVLFAFLKYPTDGAVKGAPKT